MGWIKVVGIGPGSYGDMTVRALNALRECDAVIGYITYINLIKHLLESKEIISTGMRQEVERCKKALELAGRGRNVCLVSGGDPGIYGMAGLLFEMVRKNGGDFDIEVIPGVSAANSAASVLGAPLMHDFAVISLSDHLTPWPVIEKRIQFAAKGDFVMVLYNPQSRERKGNLSRAWEIMMRYKSPRTPAGIVKNASREGEVVIITSLCDMLKYEVDMTTVIIVGNKDTFTEKGKMITPRGYAL